MNDTLRRTTIAQEACEDGIRHPESVRAESERLRESAALTRTCQHCGAAFVPVRWTGGSYCGVRCARGARKGETAAILPSETRPARKAPMTNDEFLTLLDAERRELIAGNRPLRDASWRERRCSNKAGER